MTAFAHYLFEPQKWVRPLTGLSGLFNRQEERFDFQPVARVGGNDNSGGVVKE